MFFQRRILESVEIEPVVVIDPSDVCNNPVTIGQVPFYLTFLIYQVQVIKA